VSSEDAALLIVDDIEDNRFALSRRLARQGYLNVTTAVDGRQALESAKALQPSAIVLDVNMPFIDGFEVLTTLRNDPETADIPVVMLTSVQQESDIVRGFGLVASVIGIFTVRGSETRDPMGSLNIGYYITATLSALGMILVTYLMLNEKGGWYYFAGAGIVGILTSVAFVFITLVVGLTLRPWGLFGKPEQ